MNVNHNVMYIAIKSFVIIIIIQQLLWYSILMPTAATKTKTTIIITQTTTKYISSRIEIGTEGYIKFGEYKL